MLPTQTVGPFSMPAFSQVSIEQWEVHLTHAHDRAIEALGELESTDSPADFNNTFVGLETLFRNLGGALQLFFSTFRPHATEEKSALVERWAGRLSELSSSIYQSEPLFARCVSVSEKWDDAPEAERRLMNHHLRAFRNAGQGLPPADRARLSAINAELAQLGMEFQNLCQQASSVVVVLPEEAAQGLSSEDVKAARARAAKLDEEGLGFVLQMMQVDSWLSSMDHRPSRKTLWEACAQRGMGIRDTDARQHVRRILELRTERSILLGYPTPAHHLMEETMANQPGNAMGLVMDTWEKLVPGLLSDLKDLTDLAAKDGVSSLEPWDVGYYAQEYRRHHFQFDESALREYLPLDAVRQGAFDAASRLFGLRFEAVEADLHHPDAQAYLVFQDDMAGPSGLLVVDDYLRPTKSPGAWMSKIQSSSQLGEEQMPWVMNVCNFQSPSDTSPTLLTFDDAVTVFHELGHALHALLSTAKYPSQAGTNVAQDFVELPSQILENWFTHPEALASIARHWKTGDPLPAQDLKALMQSRRFGQGIFLAQYLASAYLDLEVHARVSPPVQDLYDFQCMAMQELGLPQGIAPRHGLLHFSHLFSGDSYAAGYYSYLWSEILEADMFTRFQKNGLFDKKTAQDLREFIFAPGGSVDPDSLFRRFMGRGLSVDALLVKHGLFPASGSPSQPGNFVK